MRYEWQYGYSQTLKGCKFNFRQKNNLRLSRKWLSIEDFHVSRPRQLCTGKLNFKAMPRWQFPLIRIDTIECPDPRDVDPHFNSSGNPFKVQSISAMAIFIWNWRWKTRMLLGSFQVRVIPGFTQWVCPGTPRYSPSAIFAFFDFFTTSSLLWE